jgi:hypothetical protein
MKLGKSEGIGATPCRGLFFHPLGLYLCTLVPCILVSLEAPRNVLEQWPFLARYVSFIAQFIPSIEKIAAISIFPEVSRLIVAMAWSVVPFQILYFFLSKNVRLDVDRIRMRPWLFGLAITVGALASMTMLFRAGSFNAADIEGRSVGRMSLRILSTSRLGLGIGAALFSTFFSLMSTLLLSFCWHIPQIYFPTRKVKIDGVRGNAESKNKSLHHL